MKKFIFFIIPLLAFTSCNKFLDVQPESDITREQLFSTEEGFIEALNGVYTYCSGPDLYGGNLTFSNLDIMAQNYSFTDINYQKVASFKYTDDVLKDKNSAIWTAAYKAIGNCNEILKVIDQKKDLFRNKNYNIIKGEALTLRAYLHFDLLRMFAPSYRYNPAAKGIPYVITVGIKSTPFSSVNDALNRVIMDLRDARALLSDSDPIISAGYIVGYPNKVYPDNFTGKKQTETNNPSLFLQNRRHRMNYYSACAELARVYLYKGDYQNSLVNALDVINSGKFPFTEKDDFFNTNAEKKDKIFYNELISGWYLPPASITMLVNLFSKPIQADYQPAYEQLNDIYELNTTGAEDWRYLQWFQKIIDRTPKEAYLIKYTANSTPLINMHPVMAPALRLSEMYYIAAEASFDTDPAKAIDYFNTIRTHRGIIDLLSPGISKTTFMNDLVKECRKEFYGESQIFFMYKRLNRDIISSNQVYPASNSIFVFPVPLDEQTYND